MSEDPRRYPTRPWVGIGVVVWRDGRVLLVRRAKPPRLGEWGLPGGAQDVGETVAQAAVREVREEAGIEVEPLGIVTAVDSLSRDAEGRVEYHYTLIEVLAAWRTGEARPLSDVSEVRWATPDEAEALVAWEETRRVIRLAEAMARQCEREL